jgi:hypothetical protein
MSTNSENSEVQDLRIDDLPVQEPAGEPADALRSGTTNGPDALRPWTGIVIDIFSSPLRD